MWNQIFFHFSSNCFIHSNSCSNFKFFAFPYHPTICSCEMWHCASKVILFIHHFSIFAISPFKFDRTVSGLVCRLLVFFSFFRWLHEYPVFDLFHTFEQSQSKMNGLPFIIQSDVIFQYIRCSNMAEPMEMKATTNQFFLSDTKTLFFVGTH